MGNKAVKAAALKDKDVKKLTGLVGVLSEEEVRALYGVFCALKAGGDGGADGSTPKSSGGDDSLTLA